MLVELVLDMPPTYLRDVLIELGGNDPHVLTAALNALLDMPQGAMKKRLDLVTAFSKAMGFKFPRLSDYLAGGRHARHSYFQALATTADQILDLAEPYRALEYYLQEHRHRPPSFPRRISRRKALLAKTASAIGKADSRGTACKFSGRSHSRHRQAQRAYFDAFSACQDLLEDTPLAFQWDTIRSFWARNYEALVVLSVVRNIQQSVDNIRFWFEKLIERPIPDAEQTLVETVINALFHLPQDRQEMLQDPLVRLLIDPPEGTYDFTVISCMGVITGGARGTELEEAYQRLLTTRGIHTIRADTATARALNFNAQRIIEAIRKVDTPWGYIGYSQGCPNGLMAEAMLMAGPPDQRQLLDGLVARNLLYSAFNASSHGTLGAEKFLDTMVYLDHFLAHYQARFSSRAIRSVLRTIRLTMDSQGMMLGLAGSRSLTAWGVLPLHKGGQFKIVPTSTVRGIVEKATLPESLEFLSNVLTIQTEGDTHDSQVSILEAQGHSLLASTPAMDLLRRCDMGSRVLRTHHWAPLNKDVNFVTTRRDRDQGIYDGPKDRHVFPWIEVNARFGRIKHKDL
jgi:hypothetical protein